MHNDSIELVDFNPLRDSTNNSQTESSRFSLYQLTKNLILTLALGSGKMAQSIGLLFLDSSFGNDMLPIPKVVNKWSNYGFIMSGSTVMLTTRIPSIYQAVKQWGNCSSRNREATQPLLENDQPSPNYTPSNLKASFVYNTFRACGWASGLFITLNSYYVASLLYDKFHQNTHVVQPEKIVFSPGLFASASYVACCSGIAFATFKYPKLKEYGQHIAESYLGEPDSEQLPEHNQSLTYKQKAVHWLAGASVCVYATGFMLYARGSTQDAVTALLEGLDLDTHQQEAIFGWADPIIWATSLPSLVTTWGTSGSSLFELVGHFNNNDNTSHRPRLMPKEWNWQTTLMFAFIFMTGIMNVYGNSLGFLGSSYNALREMSPDSNDTTFEKVGAWTMALASIGPIIALNLIESLVFLYNDDPIDNVSGYPPGWHTDHLLLSDEQQSQPDHEETDETRNSPSP